MVIVEKTDFSLNGKPIVRSKVPLIPSYGYAPLINNEEICLAEIPSSADGLKGRQATEFQFTGDKSGRIFRVPLE